MSYTYPRSYWEGGDPAKGGSGYVGIGYQQFPVQELVVEKILVEKPTSVIDIGGARGYIAKMLDQRGVEAICVDISSYCAMTRATRNYVNADVTEGLYMFTNKRFDLAFSIAVFEHIPEKDIAKVIKEVARISKRGLICPSLDNIVGTDNDKTHETLKDRSWWENMFKTHAPDYPVKIVDKEDMEKGDLHWQKPQAFGTGVLAGRYVKEDATTLSTGDKRTVILNIGSFIVQFRSTEQDCVVNMDVFPDLVNFAQQWGTNYVVYEAPKRLPLKDNSVDAINCSHMLEHLTRDQGLELLRECHRVLKPDGVVRITVPDCRTVVEHYNKGILKRHGIYNVGAEKAADDAEALYELLLKNHATVYDSRSLGGVLGKAGFTEAAEAAFDKTSSTPLFRTTYDVYPEISLYVEAKKSHVIGIQASVVTTSPPGVTTTDELEGMGEVVGENTWSAKSGLKKYLDTEDAKPISDYLNDEIKSGRIRL